MRSELRFTASMALAVGVASGVEVPAAAQVAATAARQAAASGRAAGTERRIRISPFVEATSETNVLRVTPGTTLNGRNNDNRLSPGVTVDVLVPASTVQLFASGTLAYDFYRYNKQLNRERILLDAGASAPVGECRGTAAVNFARQQSDLADLRLTGATTLKNTEQRLAPRVGINCGRAVGLNSSLTYEHARVTNSSALRQFGDFESDTLTGSVGLARPSLGQVSLVSSLTRGRYINRLVPDGRRETVTSSNVGVQINRQVGRFRGYLQGGVTHVNSNNPFVSSFTGPSYSVGLDGRLGAATDVHLGLARAIQQSNLLGVSYSVSDALDARVDRALTPSLRVFAAANIVNNRYDRSPLLGFGTGRFNDRITTYSAGVSLVSARRLAIDFTGSLLRRRGDASVFDYNARVLALRLRLQ